MAPTSGDIHRSMQTKKKRRLPNKMKQTRPRARSLGSAVEVLRARARAQRPGSES